jgi:hypothetical protein
LTNALRDGQSIDAVHDLLLTDKSVNGPGTNHIFWDDLDPSAKAHAVLAGEIQELISPVLINSINLATGGYDLELVNLPIGRDGFVEDSANLADWSAVADLSTTNATQRIFVPAAGPQGFYRLRFPFTWAWP